MRIILYIIEMCVCARVHINAVRLFIFNPSITVVIIIIISSSSIITLDGIRGKYN